MVMFYDEYSTETFTTIVNKYLDAEFVQPMAAQIEVKQLVSKSKAIQSKNGATAFVQPVAAQMQQHHFLIVLPYFSKLYFLAI